MASLGYQPPLFEPQERKVLVPSVRANLCRAVWKKVRASLLQYSCQVQRQANLRRTAVPVYPPGQRVWLFTKDLPVESRKPAPRFVRPLEVMRMVNPATVQLNLPTSMRVHLTFHISRVKTVGESPLSLLVDSAPPPRIINGK